MTENGAIWRDQLTAGERAVLGRADDGVLRPPPDVLDIGGCVPAAATHTRCPPAPVARALVDRQARVNPLRAVARLAAGLPAVATGVAATSVDIRGDRIVRVGTSAGDISPGAIVFATGRPPVLDGLPLHIPSDRVKGHPLVTERAEVGL